MGWLDSIIKRLGGGRSRQLAQARILDVPCGENVRELGGYEALGGTTRYGRYLRSGDTERLDDHALRLFEGYGVTHVLDLRGSFERPEKTCAFNHRHGITWLNVPLYGYDLSDPKLPRPDRFDDYLVESYLTMLANHDGVRQVVSFLAQVPAGECALFHCAAGMDRTGVTAMLLLGAVGVRRQQIIADYAYSFGEVQKVDRAVRDASYDGDHPWNSIQARIATMATVYDALVDAYDSVPNYLLACGVTQQELDCLRERFIEPAPQE